MPAPLRARFWSSDEQDAIERLARSRTAPARLVERARIVLLSRQCDTVEEIAETLGVCQDTVRRWIHRFDRDGVAGLADKPRAGRPPTYTPAEVGAVVAASLTTPEELGLPFASWTLDRLAAYLNEAAAIPIKRSRIGEILQAEGLRWRTQETWFGERPDPEFVQKRGRSSPSTTRHLRLVS
ncbi:MAG: helix-turn-helix domain-containing protein [Actinomycetota bacterium]|nr:helix-turn-helix domain-containing protein [Actinomycetota bacterium]